MTSLEKLKELIQIFREETDPNSISPDRLGYLLLLMLQQSTNLEELQKIFLRKDTRDSALDVITFLAGLMVGDFIENKSGANIDKEGNAEFNDLKVRGDSIFNGSLSSPDFISGFLSGKGWALTKKKILNSLGIAESKYILEIDDLIVRGTMRIFEMIISQLLGENDNRVFTGMLEVDHYDPETGRIWLDTKGGVYYNPFRKGDYIKVQQFNGLPSEAGDWTVIKEYEFVVTDAGIGNMADGADRLDWVAFRGFTSSMGDVDPESVIKKGDTLARIDNDSDGDRKGLLQIISAGSKTPYLDVVYGLKTDPDNALKARLGNLQGIRHHLFGWLQGWGLYSENAYLVGDFRLRNSGDSVEAEIQMLKDRFSSQYSEISYDVTEEDNLLVNATFTENMEGWVTDQDTSSLIYEESAEGIEALLMNGNLFVGDAEAHWAMLGDYDGRRMLRIVSAAVSQSNKTIKDKMARTGKTLTHWEYDTNGVIEGNLYDSVDEKGRETKANATLTDGSRKEVANTLYLSIKFLAVTDGTLTIGFEKGDGKFGEYISPITIQAEASEEWQLIEWKGTWNGEGDFLLRYTGEMYVQLLSLTDDPLSDYKQEYGTLIEQTSRNIKLLAYNTKGTAEQTASLQIWANKIEAEVYDSTTGLSRITQTASKVETLVRNIGNFTEEQFNNLKTNVGSLSFNLNDAQNYISTIKAALTDNDGKPIEWSDFVIQSNQASLNVNKIYGDLYPENGSGWMALQQGLLNITSDFTQLGNVLVRSDNLKTLVAQAGFKTYTESEEAFAKIFASKTIKGPDGKSVVNLDSFIEMNAGNINQIVRKDGVIAAINMSAESENGSLIKIQADKVELEGNISLNDVFIVDGNNIIFNGTLKQKTSYGNNIAGNNISYLVSSSSGSASTYYAATGSNYVGQIVRIHNPGLGVAYYESAEFDIKDGGNKTNLGYYPIRTGETVEITCFQISQTRARWILTGRSGELDLNTYGLNGKFPLCLAVGRVKAVVSGSNTIMQLSGRMYDGRELANVMTMNVNNSTFVYTFSFGSNLFPINYVVMCQNTGGYANANARLDDRGFAVTVFDRKTNGFSVVGSEDNTANLIEFDFMIFDFDNWYTNTTAQ